MVLGCRQWTLVILALLASLTWCVAAVAQQGEKTSELIEMSPAEKAWIEEHKHLRLGVWLDAPPVMFRGSRGKMQGMVPAYVDLLIRKLGLQPQWVRASSFAAVWELAKAREVDMVTAVTAEPERKKDMLLSAPYLYMPIVVVTRSEFPFISGLDDLGGRVVAMGKNHVPHLRIPNDYPDVIPLPVSGPNEGLQAVASGLADAFVGAQPSVAYLSRKHGITNVRIAAMTEYSYRLSVGIRQDWPILKTLVNRALSTISEEERKEIHDYWTILRDGDWIERPHVWRLVGGVAVAALILVALVGFWNRKLAREVARRMQAEKKYRRAHKATEEIIESADLIIVGLDYTGRIHLLNQAGEALLGYTRDELYGKDWFDIVVPKERFPYVWDEFSRLIREGSRADPGSFGSPVLTKSGEVRHIQWRSSVTEDSGEGLAVIAFGTDMTHRLKAEEELRLTQFAMDNAAVGIFRIQPSGDIVYANRTAAQSLGYTRSELRQRSVMDVSPDFTRENWPDFWDRLKYNQMMTTEKNVLHRNGKSIPVEVTAYYLLFKGTELAIGFFADISERKRVERLREDVERMVRHDLRSPTLAVQTLFKLFGKADNLTEDQRELLDSVRKASRRMINIIDMSRALYRMEAGTYTVHPQQLDLLPLARAVIQDLQPLLNLKNVRIDIRLGGEEASDRNVFIVQSEEMLCYALLANLIKNAVEASPDGGTVTVNCSIMGNPVISFHNDGVIPEHIRDSFFEKYVTEGKAHGTGLGTYTAHLIVTSLGGTIGFTTSETEGTTITVELPRPSESNS